eukprot:TRINITY_DN67322_c6_g1_i1.p1 TRINITY_DN67322_c6_g1~~TRINITY_DN67322_c6_g1_i1.p1  ORF type:complete len:199 (-),score=0.61 TRINITY_DN67322_c6_g1_i1:260-856(-)
MPLVQLFLLLMSAGVVTTTNVYELGTCCQNPMGGRSCIGSYPGNCSAAFHNQTWSTCNDATTWIFIGDGNCRTTYPSLAGRARDWKGRYPMHYKLVAVNSTAVNISFFLYSNCSSEVPGSNGWDTGVYSLGCPNCFWGKEYTFPEVSEDSWDAHAPRPVPRPQQNPGSANRRHLLTGVIPTCINVGVWRALVPSNTNN